MLNFFVNPLMLLAVVLAAIPFIIEWLYRRRRRRLQFPAMRYLLKSEKQKKIRMQDLILLYLRTIMVALLVMALSRPVFRSLAESSGGKKKRDVVFLFDATYSTAQRVGVSTAFDMGKKMAGEALRGLPARTPITVAYLGHKPQIVAEQSDDGPSVMEQIGRLKVSHGSGRMSDALSQLAGFFKEKELRKPEVFIFSDLQKSTWVDEHKDQNATKDALADISKQGKIYVVDTGGGDSGNFYIAGFEPREKIQAPGFLNVFDVTVVGERGVKDAPVKLTMFVNDKPLYRRQMKLGEGAATLSFTNTFLNSGKHILKMQIEGDDLMLDNERYYLANVPEAVRVLVLDSSSGSEALKRASEFVDLSIAPPQRPGLERFSLFNVTVRDPSELSREILADYALVILAKAPDLPPDMVAGMEQYVRDGGSLLAFLGPHVRPFDYNSRLLKKGAGLMPCEIGQPVSISDPEKEPYIALDNPPHPAFAHFAGRKALEDCRAAGYMKIKLEGEGGVFGKAVAKLSNGDTLIAEKGYGAGKCVVVTTTADGEWNRFALSLDYPVFMQEFLRYVIGNPDKSVNLAIGDTFRQPVLMSSQHLTLQTPRRERLRLTPEVSEDTGVREITFDNTSAQGQYKIDTIPQILARREFIVNLLPTEGDLERLDKDQFLARFGDADLTYFPPDVPIRQIVEQSHSAKGLATPILWILLMLIGVETYLAMKFGLRRV